MGNTILIKHGALVGGKIPANALQPYELGYCDSDGLLYIGQLKNGICEAISINPSLEDARGTLGLEHGGTGVSVDTIENLKAELRIVSSDGDTMTGTLIVPNFYIKTTNGTQPALRMTVGQNDKAIIYCRTNSDTDEGGFVFRGYNEDSTQYKDLQLKYSTNMTIPILNGGTGATTAEQALINLGANNAANLTAGTLSSDRLPTIPVSKGGTGATTAASAATNLKVLPLTGGTLTGNLVIQKATVASNTYNDGNPSITFLNGTNSQAVQLVYTDYNSVYNPASLTLTGDQAGIAFIAPYVKTTLISDAYGTAAPSGAGKAGQVYFQTVS